MNLTRFLAGLSMAAVLAFALPATAQEGYKFNLTLTHKNVSQDPDGIWDNSYFTPFGNPPRLPSIYKAHLTTPAGDWTLSQLDSECTMQGDCSFVLTLKGRDGKVQEMATGSTLMGRSATLSLNYKKITTEEISEDIKAFSGSYNVRAIK
jgi:hypothetical protein